MTRRDAFVVDDIDDIDSVVDTFTEYGLAVIPGYLTQAELERARQECGVLLSADAPAWANFEDYSLGTAARMERVDIETDRFPTVLSALNRPSLEAVVNRIMGPGYIFSRTIYAILDVVGSRTKVQQLHYDKMRHFKAFIYLSDVGPKNGPFHCVPGSHRLTQQLEAENRRNHIVPNDNEARRLPSELVDDIVPVVGPAGTVILFDSDIAHHAGVVEEGSRLAIRSLSFGAYRNEEWRLKDGTLMLPA